MLSPPAEYPVSLSPPLKFKQHPPPALKTKSLLQAQLDPQRSEPVSPSTPQPASPPHLGIDYLFPTSTSATMSDLRRQLAAATMKRKWQQLKQQQKRQQRQAIEAELDRMQQEQARLKVTYNHDQQPPLQKPVANSSTSSSKLPPTPPGRRESSRSSQPTASPCPPPPQPNPSCRPLPHSTAALSPPPQPG